MDIPMSRDGFYTLTFLNKFNLSLYKVKKEFSSVGNVYIKLYHNRFFIKYKKKEEAEKALSIYGKIYTIKAANQGELNQTNYNKCEKERFQTGRQHELKNSYSLILGNLPKDFTVENVKYLIEEVQFQEIKEIVETKFLKLKFCQIILDSDEDLKYLIKKLDNFVLSREKLIAIGQNDLLTYHKVFHKNSDKLVPSLGS